MEYKTNNKKVVIDILKENSDSHFTIEQLYELLIKENKKVPLASLYRIIDNLTKQKIVKKFIVDNNASCIQYFDDNKHDHFHLICNSCGKIIHLSCDEVDALIKHINLEHDFEIDKEHVNLYGLCKDCKGKK